MGVDGEDSLIYIAQKKPKKTVKKSNCVVMH